MKPKVLITQALFSDSYKSLYNSFDCILPNDGKAFSKDDIIKLIEPCEVLLSMFNFKIDKDIISAGKNLKLISNFGVGFNNIDVDFASQKGIVVCNTPDPVIEPTAELAFALMLNAAHQISKADRAVRSGSVKWGVLENISSSITGKTLGIIGFGRIGQSIAKKALAFNMNIVYHNRKPVDKSIEEQYNAKYLSLDELLKVSDIISLNTPYTTETYHLISKRELSLMKPTCLIINTARGAVINEADLITALQNKIIAGAGLDVFENEPLIPNELKALNNVVLSPHCGTATYEARQAMATFACQNIINFYSGEGRVARVN